MKSLGVKLLAVAITVALLPRGGAQETKPDPVALTRALEDENVKVRQQALAALVKCGRDAVPDLLEVLGHKNQSVRLLAMEALGKIGPASEMAIPYLGRVLHEGDLSDAHAAGSALAKIGPAAVPLIKEMIGHKVERTRDRALAALAALEGDREKIVPLLTDLLESKDVLVRRHATTALFKNTTEPIAPVVRAFQDEDVHVRAIARDAMTNSKHRGSSETAKALEKLLHHPIAGVRVDVLQVLTHAHDRDASMKYGLQSLKDADAGVRLRALYILDTATYPIERNPYSVSKVAAEIGRMMSDPSPEVRKVAFALMQRSAAEGVPHLAELLDSKDADIRKQAAATLLYNGDKNAGLVEAKLLKLAERDPDVGVRAAAVLSYSRLGPKTLPVVADFVRKDKEDVVRVAALHSMAIYGEDAAALVPDFITALKDDNPEVRRAAAMTFYFMRKSGKKGIAALTDALKDKDAKTRQAAIYTMGVLAPESEPGVIEGIKSEDGQVQEMALHTFWQTGMKSKAALPFLIEALKKQDGPNNVRYYAVYAIANLGADAAEAIPVLEAITEPDMQIHVRFGLKRLREVNKK